MRLSTLDPRIKLLMLLMLSTVSVISREPLELLALFLLTALLLILGGVPLKETAGKAWGAVGLIATLFIIQCLFTRTGEPAISLGGLTVVTFGGLKTAALVSLRLLIIIVSALIVLTGSSRDYLLALTQLRVPYEIAFMVLAALRFLPLLRQEAQDVICAVQMRGTKLKKTGLINRASVYISVLIPIVAGAIRRSEQMSIAMEARAFRCGPYRTNMRKLTINRRDILYFAAFTLLMILIMIGV